MIAKKYFLALAVAIAWWAGPAAAQHPLVVTKLKELDAAAPPPSRQIVATLVLKSAATIYASKPKCAATGLTLETLMPATSERQVFAGAVRGQVRNAWTVMARHPACDEAQVRYMVVQDGGGALRSFRVNRGLSLAHESLIGDTFPLAVLAAKAFLKRTNVSCAEPKKPQLGIIRIAEEEGDLGPDTFGVRYKGSWTEIWPIGLCGETVEVPVHFTADGDGGAYTNMKGAGVRRVTRN